MLEGGWVKSGDTYEEVRDALLEGVGTDSREGEELEAAYVVDPSGGPENEYHNEQHFDEVYGRMVEFLENTVDLGLSLRGKSVLGLATLNHDIDHCGETYRQLAVGGELSNEEWTVFLIIFHMRNKLNLPELLTVEDHVLGTTFGQNEIVLVKAFPDDEALQKRLYRPYKPITATQKLLALADVGGFRKGWGAWVDESLNLVKEQKIVPKDIDAWLQTREGFIVYHIKPLLENLREVFIPEFYDILMKELQTVLDEVLALKNPYNPARGRYTKKLDDIRANLA